MSSGCGDVLSLEDLKIAKQHQVFEAEVITGLSGGVPGGTAIDYATNPVTGQVQKTLPAVLRDAGFRPASFTFVTGGTLAVGDSDRAVLWPVSSGGDGNYYVWKGAYPKVIPAASTPATTGGVSSSGWMPVGDVTLRRELADSTDVLRGDGMIAVKQPFTSSVARTQHDKNKESVSVLDFGAKGDGVTDDSAAFTAALAASAIVIVPYTADGYVVSNITVGAGKRICGESRVKLKSTGNSIFNVTAFSTTSPCEISGFLFDMNGAPSSSVAIVLKTSIATVYNARINDVAFANCYGAIADEVPKDSQTWTHDLEVRNMTCVFTKGTQIHLRQSNGFILFDSVKVDNTLNSSQISWSSVLFESIAGLELTRFDVLGCGTTTPTYDAASSAIRIIGTPGLNASLWLNRVLVDYTRGQGIYIAAVYNVVSDQLGVHLTLGQSITLDQVTFSRFTNTSVFGAKGIAGAPASSPGIRLDSSNDNQFVNVMVKEVTGHGIVLNNSSRNVFTNVMSMSNTANGIAESGTSNYNIKNGVYYYQNGGNSMNQVGASSATLNMIKADGTYVASTVGAATIA